jgi:hypothetical protein
MHNLKKLKYKNFPKKLYISQKLYISSLFTNKVQGLPRTQACVARSETGSGVGCGVGAELPQKSDPESDPKQIIPDPQLCF